MMLNRAFQVAALVLFILAAILAWGIVGSADALDVLGLACAGLACWVAAGLA